MWTMVITVQRSKAEDKSQLPFLTNRRMLPTTRLHLKSSQLSDASKGQPEVMPGSFPALSGLSPPNPEAPQLRRGRWLPSASRNQG